MGPDGYNTPSAIDDNFIDQLRCCCVVKERERVWLLRPGSVVTIVNGPLASHEGIVEWSSERRVRLLLHLLNHSTSVELAVSDVIAVSPST
jgi:transcription antitermination factor NusG